MSVFKTYDQMDASHRAAYDLGRSEAETRLHSLRWLLGLDTHEGEEPQLSEVSHRNLDILLGHNAPANSQEPTDA